VQRRQVQNLVGKWKRLSAVEYSRVKQELSLEIEEESKSISLLTSQRSPRTLFPFHERNRSPRPSVLTNMSQLPWQRIQFGPSA